MVAATLWEALQSVACEAPALSCLVVPAQAGRSYEAQGLEWCYGEVARRVHELVDGYGRRGWGRGHRVALLLENRPEFMLHFLALNALGAWVVPVNPDYRQEDLAELLRHSEPDLVVAIAQRCAALEAIVRTACRVVPAVVAEPAFRETLGKPPRACRAGAAVREDEAVLLYTSGTTGLPKGCLIRNDYLFFAGERYLSAGGAMTVRPREERLCNPLPLFYANSLVISNPAMILSGNAMIFPDRFHPGTWWQELVQTRATMVHYLGIIPPLLLAREPQPEERMHGVRFGVGAGTDPAQRARFEARFGLRLVEVWGMSEVGISSATQHERGSTGARSIGRPLAGIAFEVVDDEDRPVEIGTAGELVLRREGEDARRGLFAGYFRDPAATQAAWRGGWFHTGDVVRQEADGSYTFVDRKKDMVRRSGQNIAAAEVEACLAAHPQVRQVAVVPVPDEMRQEEVLACIVPWAVPADGLALAREIVRFALQRLAYFKAPGWVLFVESLPTTATQKLRKVGLFEAGEDPRARAGMLDLRGLKREAASGRQPSP